MRIARVTCAIILGLIILIAHLSNIEVNADSSPKVTVHIPFEEEKLNDEGIPRIVAGIWHQIDIIFEDSTTINLTLVMFYGDESPVEKNVRNYYEWKCNKTVNGYNWNDSMYAFYIAPSNCVVVGGTFTFYVGVDAITTYGNWTLQIITKVMSYNQTIYVEKPSNSFSLLSADFTFILDPFKRTEINSIENGQDFRVINTGNIPLRLNVTFNRLANHLNVSNISQTIHVGEIARYGVILNADSWGSDIINVEGTIKADAIYTIPTSESASLFPQIASTIDITIYIGRNLSKLELIDLGNVTFQYERFIVANYSDIVVLKLYLYGEGYVSMDVSCENATIGSIEHDNDIISEKRIDMFLLETSEEYILIQVHLDKANTTAYVNYDIILGDSLESQRFITEITVGIDSQNTDGMSIPAPLDKTQNIIIVSSCVVIMIIIMFTYWKRNRK